jgi:polygalacturonase
VRSFAFATYTSDAAYKFESFANIIYKSSGKHKTDGPRAVYPSKPGPTLRAYFMKIPCRFPSVRLGSFLFCAPISVLPVRADSTPAGEETIETISARIKPLQFPEYDFDITKYGASTDGKSDCTEAIGKAVDACAEAGGGRVVVPQGVFTTGAIHLKSNVNLYLADGARLAFSTDPGNYPTVLTRFEGVECMNYSPFIYALEQENIAVTGKGTLDGSANYTNWWGWVKKSQTEKASAALANPDRKQLTEMNEQSVPVEKRIFGKGHYLRPNFIQPYRCKNVLIEGITIVASPMWEINPVLCSNVTVRNVNINSLGPNNDGCDPASCRDVLIEGCTFQTGDDCIAIKSGRNNDGRRIGVAAENTIVRNCTMKDGHGGVTIGSEISGGCRNVFVEDCKMDSPNLDRALRFKSNAQRGGTIENVFMHNVEIGRVGKAVLGVEFDYEEGAKGHYKPVLRNVLLDHVTSQNSPRVVSITSFPSATIEDIRITNCTFRGVKSEDIVRDANPPTTENVTIERATEAKGK